MPSFKDDMAISTMRRGLVFFSGAISPWVFGAAAILMYAFLLLRPAPPTSVLGAGGSSVRSLPPDRAVVDAWPDAVVILGVAALTAELVNQMAWIVARRRTVRAYIFAANARLIAGVALVTAYVFALRRYAGSKSELPVESIAWVFWNDPEFTRGHVSMVLVPLFVSPLLAVYFADADCRWLIRFKAPVSEDEVMSHMDEETRRLIRDSRDQTPSMSKEAID